MAKTNYKGHDIDQHSEHRFYVKRFNDTIKGGVMFTTIEKAQAYIDSHINENVWTMKKVYNIYDISGSDGVFIQTVTKEISAKMICRQHNRNGERNYMYLQSYE